MFREKIYSYYVIVYPVYSENVLGWILFELILNFVLDNPPVLLTGQHFTS